MNRAGFCALCSCCESVGSMMLRGVCCVLCAVCAMLCIAVKILLLSRAEYRWSSSGFVAQVFLRRLCKSGDLKAHFWGEPLEIFFANDAVQKYS